MCNIYIYEYVCDLQNTTNNWLKRRKKKKKRKESFYSFKHTARVKSILSALILIFNPIGIVWKKNIDNRNEG